MKKFCLFLGVLLALILTACSTTLPVTIPGIEFEVQLLRLIEQGDHGFTNAALQEMLPDFSEDKPVATLSFKLKLIAIDGELVADTETKQQVISAQVGRTGSHHYVFVFDEMTLTQAGVHTFRVTQIADDLAEWQVDESVFYFDIEVVASEDGNQLIAREFETEIVFVNQLIHDIVIDINDALAEQHRAHLSVMHDELEVLLQNFVTQNVSAGVAIGISYYCLRTGHQISVNGDRLFHAHSTVKLAAHMMAAEAVNAGALAWDQIVTINDGDMPSAEHGSILYLRGFEPGHQRTLDYFLRYSITHSDNLGFNAVMRRAVPTAEHFGMIFTNAYFDRFFPGETPTGRHQMSPNHQARILAELYHGLGNVAGFDTIVHYMMQTVHANRFVTYQTRGHVAHIPGWWQPTREYYCYDDCEERGYDYGENLYTDPLDFSFHDSGIFFTENPYILVIYTTGMTGIPFVSNVSNAVFDLITNFESQGVFSP